MKTICIYHSRDLDGWMSAAIVKKWWEESIRDKYPSSHDSPYHNDNIKKSPPEIEFLGWDYGDEIPDLSEYQDVFMADISFPPKVMLEIQKSGKGFIWCDHHISAIMGTEQLFAKENVQLPAGIRDVKFAACELTWMECFPYLQSDNNSPWAGMPEIVRLLGRYDCFEHKGTDEKGMIIKFQYGARTLMHNYKDCYLFLTLSFNFKKFMDMNYNHIQNIHNSGASVYMYLCTEAKQTYSKAFSVTFFEPSIVPTDKIHSSTSTLRRFLAVNQERFNPINFGIDYHKKGYDGFACFWFNKGKWTFSLYNNNGLVDCSAIAKSFGGGGHKSAAGFVVEDLSAVIKTDSK